MAAAQAGDAASYRRLLVAGGGAGDRHHRRLGRVLLRGVTPFRRFRAAMCAALSAAALGACALRFYHPQDAAAMVLVWQFGSVVVLTALGGWIARRLLPGPCVTVSVSAP